ncbi:hypothetical protein SAMN05216327_102235 [Dyadobacter sp. SG02]|uniref:hypothetical protein n=1 Tax=Dyadobacter sp. SG02 TaxID=1855291 RepID=UPI0008B20442|nr:hypothetical protein [Dyadobacter sp. SG02]SEI52673.1 hypothetical protein SAMN05216327_102235 [Dyadobacter sp. SG02]
MKHSDDEINEWMGSALRKKLTGTADQPDPRLAGIILNAAADRPVNTLWAKAIALLICSMLSITPLAHRKSAGQLALVSKTPDTGIAHRNKSINLNGGHPIELTADHAEAPRTTKSRFKAKAKQTTEPKPESVLPALSKARGFEDVEVAEKQWPASSENIIAGNVDTSLSDSAVIADNGPVGVPDLKMLTARKSTFPTVAVASVEIPGRNATQPKPKRAVQPWSILFGFSPMNTFQLIHIKPNQQVTYQNFRFAPALSAKKMAYKFHAGIEQNGWQLQASYTHFTQAFYYETATDEYILKQGNASQEWVRKGIGMEESQTLNMIGIGLSKKISFSSHKLTRYLANVGVEYSHDFSARQGIAWGTVMVGRQIYLSKSTSLVLGPHLTYGLTKLNAARGRFEVQPYQVGIAITLEIHAGK